MPSVAATYEVRWRIADSEGSYKYQTFAANADEFRIENVDRGTAYEGEARAVSAAGVPSEWVPVTFTVADPSLAPRPPTSLTAVAVADGVSLRWSVDVEQPADAEYCIERATAEAGPYTEFTRVRAKQYTYPILDGTVYWFRVRAVTFGLVYSDYSNTASSAAALLADAFSAAATAQATADGMIQLWPRGGTQPTVTASDEGDYWQDDDGKWYVVDSSGDWVDATDIRLPQAIVAAAGAQATADGKVTTFYDDTEPTAEGVGDLWVHEVTKIVSRWNGSEWVQTGSAVATSLVKNGVPIVPGFGLNELYNPSFELNVGGAAGNSLSWNVGDPVCDGWYCHATSKASSTTACATRIVSTPRTGSYTIDFIVGNGTTIPTTGLRDDIACNAAIQVDTSKKYNLSGWFIHAANYGSPSGLSVAVYLWVQWYTSSGSSAGETVKSVPLAAGGYARSYSLAITPPASAVTARVFLSQICTNSSGSTITIPAGNNYVRATRCDDLFFGPASQLDEDVVDGDTYGRYSVLDRYLSGGVYRVGLRIAESGHRIGAQRNLVQSNTTSYGTVRSTTALSATSTGAVSVNAYSQRYGSFSVSYNAVSNAVTGLTQGVSYVIYCYDENFSGGTKTYYAASSPDAVMQLGDGVVAVGQITIPTSGSSSGGGGSGSGGPGDWCVEWDTVLPDGRLVRELAIGDLVECIDVSTGKTGLYPLLAIGFGEEECYALLTPSGAEVRQSRSTPMNLPGGSVETTEQMLGKPVFEKVDGVVRQSHVSDLLALGKKRVVKPDFGNRMFFAGSTQNACIATHNSQQKP